MEKNKAGEEEEARGSAGRGGPDISGGGRLSFSGKMTESRELGKEREPTQGQDIPEERADCALKEGMLALGQGWGFMYSRDRYRARGTKA